MLQEMCLCADVLVIPWVSHMDMLMTLANFCSEGVSSLLLMSTSPLRWFWTYRICFWVANAHDKTQSRLHGYVWHAAFILEAVVLPDRNLYQSLLDDCSRVMASTWAAWAGDTSILMALHLVSRSLNSKSWAHSS